MEACLRAKDEKHGPCMPLAKNRADGMIFSRNAWTMMSPMTETQSDTPRTLRTEVVRRIADVDPSEWNPVAGADFPFTRHEFLSALEHNGCLGERHGWLPRHITVRDDTGRLIGATPLYEKYNSYGELVFDWAWADAYQRNGLAYYPKLVSAIPYTPASGRRLMTAPDIEEGEVRISLDKAVTDLAVETGASSVHWLFPTDAETSFLESRRLMRRTGCQFHWHNAGYEKFDDFLGMLASRKRKNIRRERESVLQAGVRLELRLGGEVSGAEWTIWQQLYESTFDRKGGIPTLSSGFFRDLATTLPEQVVMIFARRHGDIIAGAFCMRGADTLYGRHWGTFQHHDGLHFETCYYQGIEFCIREGITRFEPGAQGEHKVARGFLPTPTWSAHWIAHEGFREAIARFLDQETQAMNAYIREMTDHSPYRTDA